MRWILKRLFRERRRIGVVAIFTFLGGYFAFFRSQAVLYGVPFPIVSGLAFMVGLTAFLAAIVILFPKIRHVAESVALSVPVLSLMGMFSQPDQGGLSTSAGIYGLLLCYLFAVVYGSNLLDRYLPQRPRSFRSLATSFLQPKALWPYLALTPESDTKYRSEKTLAIDWIEPGVRFRVVDRSGELAKIEEIQTISEVKPHQHYAFDFEVPDATEKSPVSSGRKEIWLKPQGPKTTLESVRTFDRVTIRAQILLWLDDAMGRLDDEVILAAEALERRE